MRVGIGYDVHRLVAGRRLVLGGVEIPHERGLEGHSDADVLLHAIADALLGAAALGDIGQHFPPSDPQYRDASSLMLLARVGEIIAAAGWKVANIDAALVAEQPRVLPYVPLMRERIAGALGLEIAQVGIKATTSEGLGFAGRGEGIAAWAVALIEER
ncbi:MAG: 2-C-methyl-D-erythritol 2,4-cyclodiphosphate synthase [Chloroflexi bacterium]|nr:2-C-methyl-D-erythritol 2,4-cyclodiphosphate synthase [Chloroflexota bacterium]